MTDRLFCFLLQDELLQLVSTSAWKTDCFASCYMQDELSEAKRIYPNRTSLQTVVNGLESAESDCELPCKIQHCSSESAPTLASTSPCWQPPGFGPFPPSCLPQTARNAYTMSEELSTLWTESGVHWNCGNNVQQLTNCNQTCLTMSNVYWSCCQASKQVVWQWEYHHIIMD